MQLWAAHEIDASRITENLYQGSAPVEGTALSRAGFSVLILSAVDHQPSADRFPGLEVIRVPLRDCEPNAFEITAARRAAATVASRVRGGQKVLVTCWMGRNRSGWIVGHALRFLGASGPNAVRIVQKRRVQALGNAHFTRDIEQLGAVRT